MMTESADENNYKIKPSCSSLEEPRVKLSLRQLLKHLSWRKREKLVNQLKSFLPVDYGNKIIVSL